MRSGLDELEAITNRGGWIDRSDRARLAVGGPDRAKFLHNLTTNHVKKLGVGRGQEAFVTSPQGKTIGYVTLLATEDVILVRSDPNGLAVALPHFRKYGVFDDVALEDRGAGTFEYHLMGPLAADLLGRLGAERPGDEELAHVATTVAGRPVRVVRESPAGLGGWALIGDRVDAETVGAALREGGGVGGLEAITAAIFDGLRIEAGTPVFGRDVTPENLPQEVGRDPRTIDFVKGCYLGQETVARLDALGHVNKILRGVRLGSDPVPPPGTPLEFEGRRVGTITSAASSPRSGRPVALAYVRTAQAGQGTRLLTAIEGGDPAPAVVVDLPMGVEAG